MKTKLFSGSRRTKIFTLVTLIGIVSILVLNFLLAILTGRNFSYIDITYEGLYKVTSKMKEECDEIFDKLEEKGDEKVKITFCTDPDYLMSSQTTRLTYALALNLEKMYPNSIDVKTVNANLNPTALADYKATSLTEIYESDVIVSYEGRYRIASATNFWLTGSSNILYYNGEYKMSTLLKSVTAINMPSAYFLTGHGERYYDSENPESEMSLELADFAGLLENRGLGIKTIDITEIDRIPDDCALLIINSPTEDFSYDESKIDQLSYVSDLEKIDRYLVMKQGAVMVTKDHELTLPNFETFLKGWGFSFGNGILKDEEASLEDDEKTNTTLIAQYDKDEDSYGYVIYGEFADLSSAPSTIIENAGSIECSYPSDTFGTVNEQGSMNTTRTYTSFLTTSETGKLYSKDPNTGEYTDLVGDEGNYHIASITVRSELDTHTNETVYSYLFCVNSSDFLSGKYLSRNSSYANYDIVSALTENITRFDEYASIDLGGGTLNSISGGGKKLIPTDMTASSLADEQKIYSNRYLNDDKQNGLILIMQRNAFTTPLKVFFTIAVFIAPVSLLVIGIVVSIKRKFL